MIRAHAEAIAALLAAAPSPGLRVYDTEAGRLIDGSTETVDETKFPYVILTLASPVRDTERMVQARERHQSDFTIGYHGITPATARWAAERVSALAGATLSVPGWDARVESVFTSLLRPDRDNPDQTIYSGTDGFTVTSFPV